jgi:probable H4MPT-linked C1 transfer pathway protein
MSFPSRQEGVATLLGVIRERFGARALIWAGPRGLLAWADAAAAWSDIASTNFLATASAVGRMRANLLLIDMGSTTVDIIAVRDGRPACRGLSDGDRLASGELVYTGLTRTPLMGLVDRAPFRGVWQGLTREYFATTADMRRIIGDLPEGVDQHDTADGRGVTLAESTARFARMFGRDSAEGSAEDWRLAALFLAERQLRTILEAAAQVLSDHGLPSNAPVVAAGIGAGHSGGSGAPSWPAGGTPRRPAALRRRSRPRMGRSLRAGHGLSRARIRRTLPP